ERLARLLNTNPNYFKSLRNHFKVFPFKKTVNGKIRDLFNTDKEYKILLRRINQLLCQTNIPDYVYGGVPNKNFLNNALTHRNNLYVQNADIKSFYPTTKDSYVYGLFKHK